MTVPDSLTGPGESVFTITNVILNDIGTHWCNVQAGRFQVQGSVAVDVIGKKSLRNISRGEAEPKERVTF